MFKVFISGLLFLSAFAANANYIKSKAFYEAKLHHEKLVDSDPDRATWLNLKVFKHRHYAEIKEVVSYKVKQTKGLNGISLESVYENSLDSIINDLFTRSHPYFCVNFRAISGDFTEKECKEQFVCFSPM